MTDINTWLSSNTAKIAICSNKATANAWIGCKNRYDGMVLGGIKVKTISELAEEVLTAALVSEALGCSAEIPEINVCDDSTSEIIIRQIIKNAVLSHSYKGNIELSSVDTALGREFLRVINELRYGNPIEYAKIEDKENELISSVNDIRAEYENVLITKNIYDKTRLLEEAVRFLKKYAAEGRALLLFKQYEVGVFVPWDLRPLEKMFIDLFTVHSKNDQWMKIEMCNKDISEQNISAFKAYTFSGEIRHVVNCIRNNELPVSDVEILCMNQGLADISMMVLSEAGIASDMQGNADFSCSSILRFITDFCGWIINGRTEDLGYKMRSEGIIYAGDIFAKGNKSTEKNEELNQRIAEAVDMLASIRDDISIPMLLDSLHEFFNKYSRDIKSAWNIYKPVYERLSVRYSIMDDKLSLKDAAQELKNAVEKIKVSVPPKETAVRVSVFSDRFMTVRDNLFIVGMADMHFRVNNIDSPVLPTAIMAKINEEPDIFYKPAEEIKEAYLTDSLKMLRSSRITMSYASYDIASEIPKELPVSLYFNELMRRLGKVGKSQKEGAMDELRPDDEEKGFDFPGYNYIKSESIIDIKDDTSSVLPAKLAITSSALCDLVSCPRKYYYSKVCGIYVTEENALDVGKWLPASQKGNLCHEVFEKYCEKELRDQATVPENVNEKLFDDIFAKVLDKCKKLVLPVSEDVYKNEVEEYRKATLKTLQFLHKELHAPSDGKTWRVLSTETEIGTNQDDAYCKVMIKTDETDDNQAERELYFYGTIDRIDYYTDSNGHDHYRIIDYKTGNKKKKVEEIKKGLWPQHIVYARLLDAYLHKEKGAKYEYTLDEFIYVFPFEEFDRKYVLEDGFEFDEKISKCVMASLYRREFSSKEKREDLLKAKLKSEFNYGPDCCTYCNYKSICMDRMGDEL